MSIDRIAGIFMQPHLGNGQQFTLHAQGDLNAKFTIGQIIKCRVMRHVEGNRYAVQVGNEEKVVDSSVPLKTGELLYGRVIGLNDNVELERVHVPQAMPASLLETPAGIATDAFPRDIGEQVLRLFTEYAAHLNESDAAVLSQSLRGAPDPQPTLYAGLVLSKLGLPFTPDKLDALSRALASDPRTALFDEQVAIYLTATSSDPVSVTSESTNDRTGHHELARVLAEIADGSARGATQGGDHNGNESGKGGEGNRDLGYQLLNLQIDGAMGHRIATVPLVIDGRLIELNVGLVDQREARQDQAGTTHRRMVFTLNTDNLGPIAVDGTLTGEHIQLKFQVEYADALEALQSHASTLSEALNGAGFMVDQIAYEATSWRDLASPAWLVANNVIQNDNLDKRI